MIWHAVAIDHWVTTTPAGNPISIKHWPLGWTFINLTARHIPICINFRSLKSAVSYISQESL
jgi:hypothetical protein